jgi:hypothetical protein
MLQSHQDAQLLGRSRQCLELLLQQLYLIFQVHEYQPSVNSDTIILPINLDVNWGKVTSFSSFVVLLMIYLVISGGG